MHTCCLDVLGLTHSSGNKIVSGNGGLKFLSDPVFVSKNGAASWEVTSMDSAGTYAIQHASL